MSSQKVPKGYKHTEVGVIPEDWDVKSVSEFANIKTGPFGTLLKAAEYSGNNGVPLISVGEIRAGFLRITEHTPRVPDVVVRRLPQYILRQGDIVFGRKGGVERSALIEADQEGYFLGSDGISVRPLTKCHAEYLAYQFQSCRVMDWLIQNATGTTMPSLNQEILGKVFIPIPPTIAEQRQIALALSDIDALIEALEGAIGKKRQIKQGAMQELLTGKQRLPGFDNQWEMKRFGELVAPRSERVDPRKSRVHNFCIELEHIGSGTGLLVGSTTTGSQSSLKSVFYQGDVLFGKLRAYLRKYWQANRSGVCSTEIWVLSPKDKLILTTYLFQVIQTDQFIEIATLSYGTHMPRSDWSIVKSYELFLPPTIEEQKAIATILSDMDTDIAAIEAKLTKTRQLKQGMMHELLTGRIRLV